MSMRCRGGTGGGVAAAAANTAPSPLNTVRNEFVVARKAGASALTAIQLIRERMPGTPSLMSLKDAQGMKFSHSAVPGEFITKRSEAVPRLAHPSKSLPA